MDDVDTVSEDTDRQTGLRPALHDQREQQRTIVVDDAAWAFIVHDLNPRAMSPKVKGFQPAQSWYQDFTKVTVE